MRLFRDSPPGPVAYQRPVPVGTMTQPRLLGRIPRVDAVSLPHRPSALRQWRDAWNWRHTAAVAAGAPVLYAVYHQVLGGLAPGDPWWPVLLAMVSLAGGVVLASYLPATGRRSSPAAGSPCALGPVFSLVFAGVVINGSAGSPVSGLLALGLVVLGLLQRLYGAASCNA